MAQATWEKGAIAGSGSASIAHKTGGRLKFLIGGGLVLAAVVYLVVSGTLSGAQYFITVDQVVHDTAYAGQTVRLTGAVIGDSIRVDTEKLTLDFDIANVPTTYTDLGQALHDAVLDKNATRLHVHIENEVKPDLLKNEAQAIMTGKLDANGVFQGTELLLKCPSRFMEQSPDGTVVSPSA